MTSEDRPTNRPAVFERDEYACRHCGADRAEGSAADALRAHRVGPESSAGTVHEALLVTVCADCFRTLHPERESRFDGAGAIPRGELFDTVREFTREQGGAVSAVSSFASVATGLPETVEADADSFPDARREAVLAIDVVDARLERLRPLRDGTDGTVEGPFEEFLESATALQSELRAVLELGDAVPAALGRCRGCFDDRNDDEAPCPVCGCEPPALEAWRADGAIRLDRLFAAINGSLEAASDRTEELTDRSATLAKRLTDA